MTQDALILLLFKVMLIFDALAIFTFIAIYTAVAKWWQDQIGRTIVIKDALLGVALLPSILAFFFTFSRLGTHIAAWVDVGLFGLIGPVMAWRCVIWIKIHRKGDGDAAVLFS